jgi:hypothetical protein
MNVPLVSLDCEAAYLQYVPARCAISAKRELDYDT